MQVILTKDVENVGNRGDVLDVSKGYARNFLVARGLAEVATQSRIEEARRRMEEQAEQERQMAERAEEIAATLNKSVITIEARVGEEERIFGSVTAAAIAEAIKEARDLHIDRRKIQLSSPIRELGTYQVPVQVHGDIEASVKVIVVPKL